MIGDDDPADGVVDDRGGDDDLAESRRMKFISRTTVATILTEEIDSAVPRNSEVIRRLLGIRQHRFRQQLAERKAADERHDDAGERGDRAPRRRPAAPA